MDPITLRPSTTKWLYIGGGCAAFVLIGFIVRDEMGWILSWIVTVPFGIGVVISLVVLAPNSFKLELDANGFTVTKFFRKYRLSWASCSEFELYQTRDIDMVVFDSSRTNPLQELDKFLSNRNDYLPNTFGLTGKQLADIMNSYRDNYLAAAEKSIASS